MDFRSGDLENPLKWSLARKWYITIICIFLTLNGLIASTITAGTTDSIMEEFDTSRVTTQLTTTLFLLGFCVGPLLFAPLSEFYGRRWILYITHIFYFAFTYLTTWPPNFGGLLVGRFLAGSFVATSAAIAPSILVDIWDNIERGNAIALLTSAAAHRVPVDTDMLAKPFGRPYDIPAPTARFLAVIPAPEHVNTYFIHAWSMTTKLATSYTEQELPFPTMMRNSIQTSLQGPYVGTGVSTRDEDVSIESKDTRNTQRPAARAPDMLKALGPAALMLLAVFWINSSHLFGIFLNQGKYVKQAKVALADFDGGDFGEALRMAAGSNNQSYGYPTYISIDASQSSLENIKQDVFEGKYWAAVIVQAGASLRFEEALNGTASSYDPDEVYTYYLMPTRYYTLYASSILTTTVTIASTAGGIFSNRSVTQHIATGRFANTSAAASALATPARAVKISAAPQDYDEMHNKALLNTIGAVFPVLMQFFFIMAWNGICNGMHLYAAYKLRDHILARLFWSCFWPLVTSLCCAGWTFAFRGAYQMDAKMFFAYWAVTWVYCMINFDAVDVITGFVPMAFVPFIFLTWIISNVAASLGAPTLLHEWYHINYFFPALHWFQTSITIFSSGGINRLYYTLPVLAVWLVALKCVSPFATKTRVKKAKESFIYLSERDALEAPGH
ncbi:MFS-type transporter [Paramyrothecium foliicola]|nr:MFS-type transporter [Paramyrothecium foliicola]